jgi:hypothetical protein
MTSQQRASRDENPGNAIGRLRPGVSLSQAQVEIAGITSRFDPPFQQQQQKPQGVVRPFDEEITDGARRPLLIFMAAVLPVLLIACSNVAGLGLARASGRRQEIVCELRWALHVSGWGGNCWRSLCVSPWPAGPSGQRQPFGSCAF